MFTATLPAHSFKKIIQCLSSVVIEADLKVTQEGIKFTTMDPSHISMIDFHMGKERFEEYFLDGETSLGLDIDEIRKVMNRSSVEEFLTLKADPSDNRLTLEFKKRDSNRVRRFNLVIIDVIGNENEKGEKYKVPALDHTAHIEIPAYVLDDAIKDCNLISDDIVFEANPPLLLISTQGDSRTTLTEVRELIKYEVKEKCKSSFSTSFLSDMCKFFNDSVKLSLGTDMPIRIDSILENANFIFIQAPRVEREA